MVIKANIICNDGSESATCSNCHTGCCSGHLGCTDIDYNYSQNDVGSNNNHDKNIINDKVGDDGENSNKEKLDVGDIILCIFAIILSCLPFIKNYKIRKLIKKEIKNKTK